MRREFGLPEEDTEFLMSRRSPWETVIHNGEQWLLSHGFPAPAGYSVDSVTVAVQIPGTYPPGALDMAYFHPPLVRNDGKRIPNTEHVQDIGGIPYQRWSRHRSGENPWRAGVDNIATHLSLVERWLEKELARA